MTPDLKELERLARAATPGPWFVQYGDDANFMCMTAISTENRRSRNEGQFSQNEIEKLVAITLHQTYPFIDPECTNDDANSAYIAYANPAVILSLIAELTRPETTLVSIMRAELEQAKKDAERYRWLRKSHHDDDSAIGVTRERMNGWGRVVGKSLRNSDLDKAIDAAIVKEQS